MTHHRIIAQPWQIEAAKQGRLGAVIVPLPDVILLDGNHLLNPTTSALPLYPWGDQYDDVYKALPSQIGDRLYLAEQWFQNPGRLSTGEPPSYELKRSYPPLVMPSEDEDWQPAETMPLEAARISMR
jgi:hypothetical protein